MGGEASGDGARIRGIVGESERCISVKRQCLVTFVDQWLNIPMMSSL